MLEKAKGFPVALPKKGEMRISQWGIRSVGYNSRTMIRRLTIFVFALLALGLQPECAMACPTCKNAFHHSLALGYAISIVFMMAMPFLIFAFWIVTILRLRSKHAASSTTESAGPDVT